MTEHTRAGPPPSVTPEEALQPWFGYVERALPPVLLVVATAIALIPEEHPPADPAGTLALATLAGAWVLLTDTVPPAWWRTTRWRAPVSFAGLVVFATVLMLRDPLFLVFLIAGFFVALRLRPLPVVFAALAVCSTLIHTIPQGGPVRALTEEPFLWLTIVAVQTLAIGGGAVLSDKIAEQNEARRKAVAELESALEENAGLHGQLLVQAREAGVLAERQRLSREIHDTLAQGFTGIITQLEAAAQARHDPAELDRHLAQATALARENLTDARRSVRALGPEVLDTAELPDALADVARRWSTMSGVPAEFTTTGTARPLHPEIEATLLRVTQEALANVAKHAQASRVGLTLSYMEDQVTLDVRDDGVGFGPEVPARTEHGGFGLAGMRHRVRRLAGTLHVESEPGAGTAVSASVPAISAGEPA
ncbi:sensor histidine kinase [Amycolatopsis arida]|uniref:sensor histidine kinase n=1 Tax=Amycolatopsis arida TaxID=587909 RepID=UPI000B07AD49|nr:sensor histidine kinase [Amycolatopsis arida]